MEKLFVSVVFLFLSEYIIFCCSSECSSQSSRSTTVCNNSTCSADKSFINEGIQLLIPSWNFTCQGTIISWFAHVEGNKSVTGLLEFQIFKPETIDADGNVISYTLVHGNEYKGNDAEGSLIKRSVDLFNPYFLPIKPGYIVGIYLPPNTADILELMYEDEGNTDVYYWTGVENRKCHYSLCSGKVKSSVNLFVGWDFKDSSLTQIITSLNAVKVQDPLYCQGSMDQCVVDITTSSISSSGTFSSVFQTTPISISSSTKVVAVSSNPYSLISTTSSSIEPNASNENTGLSGVTDPSGVTDLQISLLGAVLILMVLIVVLLISLIIMFQVCRKRKQRILNIVVENGQDHATRGHVSTSMNPSYTTHTVLDCEPAHEAIEMKVNPKIVMNGDISNDYSEIYVEMDEFQETSRKDYQKLYISSNAAAEYCVPNSSAKKLSQPDNDEMYISMNGSDNKVLNQLFTDKAQHDYDYCI